MIGGLFKVFLHKLKIGNVELDNNILLAPMAGVTDLSFRKICKEFKCQLNDIIQIIN